MTPILYALAPLLVLGPGLACVAPRSMAVLYLACGVFALAAYFWRERKLPAVDKRWFYAIAAFTVYGCATQIWTVNPDETSMKALEVGGMFAISALLYGVLQTLTPAEREWSGRLIVTGLLLGCGIFLFELHNNFPLYDLVRGGHSNDVADVKQNKAAFLLALWFYLSFAYFVPDRKLPYKIAYLALYFLMLHVTFTSKSASAQAIIVLAPVMGFVMYVLPARAVLAITFAVTVFLSAAMPFGAVWVYRNTDWKTNPALNDSVRSRIEIWDQASRRAFEKPLLGWGLDASPKLPNRNEITVIPYIPDPKPIAHLHPHNAPIQIWFELGLAGVAMVCAFYFFLYRRIRRIADNGAQKFAAFSWAATFLYTLSIWGIWQSWFTATICFMTVMTPLALRRFD